MVSSLVTFTYFILENKVTGRHYEKLFYKLGLVNSFNLYSKFQACKQLEMPYKSKCKPFWSQYAQYKYDILSRNEVTDRPGL